MKVGCLCHRVGDSRKAENLYLPVRFRFNELQAAKDESGVEVAM